MSLTVVAIYGALWLVASLRLPHADCPWTALVPGAVLLSAGAQVLHLVTVYYLTDKLHSSSELYGALGAAAAVLLWLFLIGRLIVASALLERDPVGARPAPASRSRSPTASPDASRSDPPARRFRARRFRAQPAVDAARPWP